VFITPAERKLVSKAQSAVVLSCNCFQSSKIWPFGSQSPEESIQNLQTEIDSQLAHVKFQGKPQQLLFETVLTEIYKRSQCSVKEQRVVNNQILSELMDRKSEELQAFVDHKFLPLLDLRFTKVYQVIDEIKGIQQELTDQMNDHGEEIRKLKESSSNSELPKFLALPPTINSSAVIGRQPALLQLHDLLSTNVTVAITGLGGMGKTTLAKFYIHEYESQFDHIIWLEVDLGLLASISLNQDLNAYLDLNIYKPENEDERFNEIIRKLNQVPGNNLLVLNGYKDDTSHLNILSRLRNWKILVTTRQRLQVNASLILQKLPFEDAKILFKRINPNTSATDEQLCQLFDLVECNLLIIELVSKTLYNSLDLTIDVFLSLLVNQQLDSESLQINVDIDGEQGDVKLLSYLLKVFDIGQFDLIDRYFMEFFAMLPGNEISLRDLVEWFGDRSANENKVHFANAANKLHSKGLIERDGDKLYMHKMFQESILYQARQRETPFKAHFLHVNWLIARLREGFDHDPARALRMLKYGESFINNIKPQFRGGIEGPMLFLENEVLNIFNWLITNERIEERWKEVIKRAEDFYPENHAQLGILYNNYALALNENDETDGAIEYFTKAIDVLDKNEEQFSGQLITAICNLSQIYINKKDIRSFDKLFHQAYDLRKKHGLWEDSTLPAQANLLGYANQSIGNWASSISMFNLAINTHLELPKDKRNDLNLVLYMNSIAVSYLFNGESEKAEKAIISAVNVLDRQKIENTKALAGVTNTMIMLSEHLKDEENAEKLRECLKSLYQNLKTV
jgi:tetratricopeptide (TPR) repeat protein